MEKENISGLPPVEETLRDKRLPRRKKWLSLIFLVLIVAVCIFIAVRFSLEEIKQFIRMNPQWIWLISVLIYFAWSMTLIPSFPLTVFLAAMVGPLHATLIGTLGMTLTGLVEYHMGAQMNAIVNIEALWAKLPQKLRDLPVDSVPLLIFGRMLPVSPKIIGTIAGAKRIHFWRYTWTTLVVSLIGAALPAYSAAGILRISW
ncbi:MAG: VTT domain-containing protein [Anaerolineaceae bacterium]|nr:VTT domain-containing protein [Anaerolineaceae bacterium]